MVKKPRSHTPVITESESIATISPPTLLVIKLSAQKKAPEKATPGLGKISSHLQDFLIILSSRPANLLIWDAETEVAGEQGDCYDLLLTYRKGDEASYFVSDEPEGCAIDVGPSRAGEDKESPMASSSRELVAEPMASEGGPVPL